MSEIERRTIKIPEITRVEGHSAVDVDIQDGKVLNVQLNVFEGARFFEKIVLGHPFQSVPDLTSRVCAICSTGHVLAAIFAVEDIIGFHPSNELTMLRELAHLGMVIESHATHVYALALPDLVGASDLMQFATQHAEHFSRWSRLRKLGATIQTVLGGRPFHPVNIHVGGLSTYPTVAELEHLDDLLADRIQDAVDTCELLMRFHPALERTTNPSFLALVPEDGIYGFFGSEVKSSEGWQRPIHEYKDYLDEGAVSYSHAKRSSPSGKPTMVGAMARQFLFGERLIGEAKHLYQASQLAAGDTNSLWNNLAQAIEISHAILRCREIIDQLVIRSSASVPAFRSQPIFECQSGGRGVGAVECPRGTLYHAYELSDEGRILSADMVTPSAQNTWRIECDIRNAVEQSGGIDNQLLSSRLETLVRAYDPCNTCATHMVSVRFK